MERIEELIMDVCTYLGPVVTVLALSLFVVG